MFTLSQRDGRDSGLRLWRIRDPLGRIVGYNVDLCEILIALHRDGESVVMLETPGGNVAVELITSTDLPGNRLTKVPDLPSIPPR